MPGFHSRNAVVQCTQVMPTISSPVESPFLLPKNSRKYREVLKLNFCLPGVRALGSLSNGQDCSNNCVEYSIKLKTMF